MTTKNSKDLLRTLQKELFLSAIRIPPDPEIGISKYVLWCACDYATLIPKPGLQRCTCGWLTNVTKEDAEWVNKKNQTNGKASQLVMAAASKAVEV